MNVSTDAPAAKSLASANCSKVVTKSTLQVYYSIHYSILQVYYSIHYSILQVYYSMHYSVLQVLFACY